MVLRAGTKVTPKLLPVLPDRLKRVLSGRALVIDGNTLDPTLQMFTRSLGLIGVPGLVLDEHDLDRSRQAMRDLCVSLGGPPAPVRVDELSIPRPGGLIGARHYRPEHENPAPPLLVFFHGGGYVMGDLDAYDALCRQLCHEADLQVLSVDYRLAPEHKAPAAVDDCLTAYRWAVRHADRLGADPTRIAVGGDSAGGALAAVVAQQVRDDDGPRPVLQLLIYPWADIAAPSRSRTLFAEGLVLTQHDLDWCAAAYLDGSEIGPSDPRVAPLRAADLAGLPPAIVLTAGFDPLRDEGERYARALADAGVPVDLRRMPSLVHGFVNFNALGGACAAAVAEMIVALRDRLRHDDGADQPRR